MDSQVIRDRDGKPIYALVPIEEYDRLLRAAEDLADLAVHEAVKDQETVPAELVYRIMDGENRVRAWRNYRGLSQDGLARRVDVSQAYLSSIETGKSDGSVRVLAAIARALEVDLDDLVPATE
ncbi:MAG: helix-turn-helix transcriptional regulator [Alphaproteobacteria bacterium]|nr:helix-turn-helix transcriptional regulator [Alphaproteobacteria bacterium]